MNWLKWLKRPPDTVVNPDQIRYWQEEAALRLKERDEAEARNLELQNELVQVKGKARQWRKKLYRFKSKMQTHQDHKVRSCIRKVRYECKEEAQCTLQIEGNESKMYIYPCEYCKGYHITKTNPQEYER